MITRMRNHLYDQSLKPSIGFELPVICVGNLTVGGTGKTPHIEYLIRLLKDNYQVATLSRGYGRKTRGFLLAEEAPSAHDIGDEPMQFYQKYGNDVVVSVGEQRAFAIPSILQSYDNTQVILLDDAYQHRKVRPSFNILLTDYNRPFYHDFLLPAGRLRESRKGAKRAQAIIVSKCPHRIDEREQLQIVQKIRTYTLPEVPIFFTGIKYGKIKHISGKELNHEINTVLLLTGIAKSAPFKNYIADQFNLQDHLELADHISYTPSVIEKIRLRFQGITAPHKAIITTEKDAVKLMEVEELQDLPIFYIPIEINFFGEAENTFNSLISQHIQAFQVES